MCHLIPYYWSKHTTSISRAILLVTGCRKCLRLKEIYVKNKELCKKNDVINHNALPPWCNVFEVSARIY